MKVSSLALAAALSANVAFADFQAQAIKDGEVDEPYTTIASYEIDMPRGYSEYELLLDEPAEAGAISMWYTDSLRCDPFAIVELGFAGEGEDAELTMVEPLVYEGIAHFQAPMTFSRVYVKLYTDRFFGQECLVHLRKANFVVPQLITLLGRVQSECDAEGLCEFSLVRIDEDTREILLLDSAEVADLGLVEGRIYKIKGYLATNSETEVEYLKLLSAQEILN